MENPLFFGFTADRWHVAMLISLVLAALLSILVAVKTTGATKTQKWKEWGAAFVSFLVLVTSIGAVQAQKQEAMAAKADLERYKREAGQKISAANERAAKANYKAEVERIERLKLELQLAPRAISPSQHAALVEILKANSSPKGEIVVIAKLADEEALNFAKQVANALRDGGFKIIEKNGPITFKATGAWIVVNHLEKLQSEPNSIGLIQQAFNQVCGINLDGRQRQPEFPNLGDVVIAIGAKPALQLNEKK